MKLTEDLTDDEWSDDAISAATNAFISLSDAWRDLKGEITSGSTLAHRQDAIKLYHRSVRLTTMIMNLREDLRKFHARHHTKQ